MRSIRNAPKRAINLTLNAKVLDMAKAMGLVAVDGKTAVADTAALAPVPTALL